MESSRIRLNSSSPKNEHSGANADSDPFTSPKNEHTRADSDPFFVRGCCCFWNLSCFTSRRPGSWERIPTSDYKDDERRQCDERSNWWHKGVTAIKKVREWSELVAGPRWKTFTRRFNKSRRSKRGKFQYDPFSYALNFDEGKGRIGHFDDDRVFRDFSSRYAAIPVKSATN